MLLSVLSTTTTEIPSVQRLLEANIKTNFAYGGANTFQELGKSPQLSTTTDALPPLDNSNRLNFLV